MNMNNMAADFGAIFEGLERLGPERPRTRLLRFLRFEAPACPEIGCGKGIATSVLTNAMKNIRLKCRSLVVDNDHQPCLDILNQQALELGLESNIKTVCASMMDLLFEAKSFDLIWSEGSALHHGCPEGTLQWRKLLADDGSILVVNDLVWNTENLANQPEVSGRKSTQI
ncbi:class I SAM-dependent methyltransferase [Vibrio chagasii]|nr:class I SAM-dependent methyltransferase [Vibrio chagasii]